MLDKKATFLKRNIDAVTGELETAPVPKNGVPEELVLFSSGRSLGPGVPGPRLGLAALLQVRLNGGLDDGRLADAVFLSR